MVDPVVSVQQGKVKGKLARDYHGGRFYSFLGIPYAKAPVGELRFKAPQPPEEWTDVRDCTKYSCESPSLDMYFGYFIGDENNCLNLNVYTKEVPSDNELKKPVMVWIHGGAFLYGSNKADIFGPDYLMTQDIVFVNINYRLGILGFLSLKDTSLDVPGNAGLKDMVMALKWINKNIDKFGGDPNNITIFGESAGSASVNYLLLSPLTKGEDEQLLMKGRVSLMVHFSSYSIVDYVLRWKGRHYCREISSWPRRFAPRSTKSRDGNEAFHRGLFHKAIMQSGSVCNSWTWGTNNASYAAKHLGYKETEEKLILEKLKNESAKDLVKAQHKVRDVLRPDDIRPWGPVVEPSRDGAFLSESPIDILKTGRQHQVPVIIGYNSNEGLLHALLQSVNPQATLPHDLQMYVPYELNLKRDSEESKAVASAIKKFYYDGDDPTEKNIEKSYLLIGDLAFSWGIQQAVNYMAESSTQPIYMYRMSVESSLNFFRFFALSKSFKLLTLFSFLTKISGNYVPSVRNLFHSLVKKTQGKKINGVSHADDLFYLFTTFFTPKIVPGSEEDVYIQKFVKLWTNFAKTGNPTPERDEITNNVSWSPVEKGSLQMLDIGKELKIIENVDKERMKFWDDIYAKYLK